MPRLVCSGEKIYCARSPGVGQNKGLRLPAQRCVMTKVYPVVINVLILRILIFSLEIYRMKHSLSSSFKGLGL